jgi:hypothetical protein
VTSGDFIFTLAPPSQQAEKTNANIHKPFIKSIKTENNLSRFGFNSLVAVGVEKQIQILLGLQI